MRQTCRLRFYQKIFIGLLSIYLVLLTLTWFCKPVIPPPLMTYEIVDNNAITDTKHILFFTNFWHYKYWKLSNETIDKDSPELKNCRFKNCIFTHKRKFLHQTHEYDAVIFHQSISAWYHKENLEPIKTRSQHQLYVMASQEGPGIFPLDYWFHPDFFNMTMTYRLDSDISWYYGKVIDIESGHKIAPAYDIKWKEPEDDFEDDEVLEIFNLKPRTAVWFVSQCNRTSGRDHLAEKLEKFIDVDIFGACGNKTCSLGPNMFNTTYKFYFAFENSLCIDYLTEKTFKVMNDYIIPVIYSGVDIHRFLPPKSYIDANSFETAEDLGKYLKSLSQNPKEFVKYFWWKKYYRAEQSSFDVCDICKKLNEPNLRMKQNVYLNINKWFGQNVCSYPRIKF